MTPRGPQANARPQGDDLGGPQGNEGVGGRETLATAIQKQTRESMAYGMRLISFLVTVDSALR
ncbi:hypothetical protein Aph01nite_20640 [Acrocarpospora phusangensis]|uniref:Uncharacterized protein n=1 Tax=Acrocarpospora phusangensis TaxID=1070424 RepID=A0A919Q9N6_9ACTN|nr:hypothetical protein Aph01nite_20640 [Acrocarpospora phusangensis]